MTRRPAFTLIELLIVTAVFSLVALVATTVITRIQTSQRQILGRQRVVADGRYLLETVARTVRQNFITYEYYGSTGPNGPQTILATKDQTNVEICYRLDNPASPTKIQVMSGAGVTACAGGSWIDITPADLQVTDFHVYITPRSDPFKSVPRQSTNCAVAPSSPVGTSGFDTNRSVCACRFSSIIDPTSGQSSDCLPDQACMTTTGTNIGQTCLNSSDTCICQNANQQPEVTIVMSTRTKNQSSGERASATLQTTVTSHIYRR